MRISEIVESLSLEIQTPVKEDVDIKRGYVSEMLSDVMANCPDESVLVSILSHENVIAVCILKDIKLVILANSRKPNEEMKIKAEEEDITVATSKLNAFQICQKLAQFDIA